MQFNKKVTLILILLLAGIVACQGTTVVEGPQRIVDWAATPFPARAAAATATPFASPPPISLPTVRVTAVSTKTVVIPTMAPTPVPPGVYTKESDGFSFQYPMYWEVLDDTGGGLWLQDPDLSLVLNVSSAFKDDESSFDVLLEEFSGEAFASSWDMSTLTVTEESELPFAGTLTAQTALLTGTDEDGLEIDFWVAYAESETRTFTVLVIGLPENVAARSTLLRTMLDRAEVGEVRLFGQDRSQTVVLLGGDPLERSLDPARQTGSAAGYVGLLYSGLVRLSPEMQVTADLAESWTVSEDGTVYTFTLREGLTFASERPLTAADVKASWERAADPDTGSTTAATYLGDIAGVQEKLDGEADEISGVRVVDPHTLEVTLVGPIPYFLAKLTYPVSFVIDVDTVDEADESWVFSPDSSGPFLLHEYREDEAMVFTRNEAYHTPPQLAGLVYLTGRVGSSISLYEAGEIDVAYLGATDAERVRRPSDELHEEWVSTTAMCTTFIQFNNEVPPFDDPDVRRAFALAVDKEGYNDLVSEGTNLVAGTIFPPAMPGYSQEVAGQSLTFAPDAALAALAESDYADDLPAVTIGAAGFGDADQDDLNYLIEGWREVLGVEVTITWIDPINFTEAVREEETQMVSYGWCADYPDPENFVDVLYHTESEFNVSGYSNAEVDALLEEARVELDPEVRLSLYQEIETALLTDVAVIPLTHGVSDAVVKPRVQGFALPPMGASFWHLVSLAPEENGSE